MQPGPRVQGTEPQGWRAARKAGGEWVTTMEGWSRMQSVILFRRLQQAGGRLRPRPGTTALCRRSHPSRRNLERQSQARGGSRTLTHEHVLPAGGLPARAAAVASSLPVPRGPATPCPAVRAGPHVPAGTQGARGGDGILLWSAGLSLPVPLSRAVCGSSMGHHGAFARWRHTTLGGPMLHSLRSGHSPACPETCH